MSVIKLKEVVTYRKQFIEISDQETFKRCRVQMHRRGVKLRDIISGSNIKTKKQRLCKSDDFIVAEMDAKFGGYGIVPKELHGAIVSSHYYLYELDKTKLLPEFLTVIIDSGAFDEQIKSVGSTNYSRISAKEVLEYEIPCPSLDDQRSIINFYFNSKEKCFDLATELTHQQTLLKKLRQQILQEAIEGKLTADWRKQNSPPLEGCPKGGVVKLRNTRNYLSLPYNPKLKQRARELRKAGNLSEVLFWNQIKRKQFLELDFDRQKIIGNYIVDFYCANVQVVIEIDGSSHDDKQDYDDQRNAYLEGLGLTVIHLLDKDVKRNLDGVLSWLKRHSVFIEVGVVPEGEALLPAGKTPPHPTGTPPKEGNWESAGELLARIKAEKEQLIKDKKIKEQKSLPPITDEEKPFEVPEEWEWTRVGEITNLVTSGSRNWKSFYSESGASFIRSQDIKFDRLQYANRAFVKINKDEEGSRTSVKKGDWLITITGGNVGKCAYLADDPEDAYVSQHVGLMRPVLEELGQFGHVWLTAEYGGRGLLSKFIYGDKPGLNLLQLKGLLFPLPSINEQKTIVTKVEKLFAICDQLEAQIISNQTHAEQLMQAVLKETFQQSSKIEVNHDFN